MTRPRPALIFIFITLFLDVLGLSLIIPILPRLIDELTDGGIDNASYMFGALAGIYSLMQFVCAPVIGSLSDRFGRKPVILVSLFGSGIDYFLMGWAPTLAWFFIARIISASPPDHLRTISGSSPNGPGNLPRVARTSRGTGGCDWNV